MFKKLLCKKNDMHEIVDKLHHYGFLNPVDWKALYDYKMDVERALGEESFIREELFPEMIEEFGLERSQKNISRIESQLTEIHSEMEFLRYVPFGLRVSIHAMHDLVYFKLWSASREGETNRFFDFKELVEMINCYFEIKNPYKPSNKIAYGWNFALTKDNFRPYLFGCIRNYLRKNDVEFETSDLQKICCLRDIEQGDC